MNRDHPEGQREHLRALAEAYGIAALHDLDEAVFARAADAGSALGTRTPRTEAIALEPAHACRFSRRGPRR